MVAAERIGDFRKSLIMSAFDSEPKALWIIIVMHNSYARCDEALLKFISRGITGRRLIDWYLDVMNGVDPRQAAGHKVRLFTALNHLLDDPHGAHESDVIW